MLLQARKCSRCERLYERYSKDGTHDGFIFVNVSDDGECKLEENVNDLCPNCMSKLDRWFANGVDRSAANDDDCMRLRDVVANVDPSKVSRQYTNGICGCPKDYAYLNVPEKRCQSHKKGSSYKNCEECWNRIWEGKEAE